MKCYFHILMRLKNLIDSSQNKLTANLLLEFVCPMLVYPVQYSSICDLNSASISKIGNFLIFSLFWPKFPSKKSKNSFKFPSQNFDAAMLIQQPLMKENLYFTMNIKKLYIKRTNILIKLMDIMNRKFLRFYHGNVPSINYSFCYQMF